MRYVLLKEEKMAELNTSYMGLQLKNPIVVGACSLSKQIDTIRQLEAAGAGALVIKSLFEEQIQLERVAHDATLHQYDELYAEAIHLFPKVPHGGPKEHLHWITEARKAVAMPLIASLNAVSADVWVDYARQLADSGVDGLELNFYSLPLDPAIDSSTVEKSELDTFSRIRTAVKIPIAVKLHPNYTSMLHMATSFDRLGANAIVLFNRLFQPDIDVAKELESKQLTLSTSSDSMTSLRWTALLYSRIKADLITSTGIMNGNDVVRMILAGAAAVQVVSTLYLHKITQIGLILADLETWMKNKGYKTLADFRGKVSKSKVKDPWGFERGQYIKALLGFD
jgi:dihydroorotate dehydrogenase (fumarate)